MAARPATDDEAAWKTIVSDIVEGIGTRWHIGEQIPTYRAMAARHGVSLTPVRTAYNTLKTAGVLQAQAGRGVWLIRPLRDEDDLRGAPLARRVDSLETEVARLRAEYERLVNMLPGWPPTAH